MLWSEIKKWAKDQGYETLKEKDDSVNGASYYWAKLDDPKVSGVSLSVSKLAKAIYNHITIDKWVEHQTIYKQEIVIDEPGKF